MFSWKLITSECVEQEIKYICYMFRTQENYLSSPLTLSCIQKCTADSQSRLWTEMPSSDLVTLSFGICRKILFTYCKSNLLSCKHHQPNLFPRVQSKLVQNLLSHFWLFPDESCGIVYPVLIAYCITVLMLFIVWTLSSSKKDATWLLRLLAEA